MERNKTFVFAAQGKEVNMEESAKASECGDTSSKRARSEEGLGSGKERLKLFNEDVTIFDRLDGSEMSLYAEFKSCLHKP
ncbi:hypothetical protein ACOSQ4_006549 [Xanthoceras sorbifolium]